MAATEQPKRQPVMGCIADDVTGATDLAINLVQGGLAVVQVMGVPTPAELSQLDADAIVVALKTRSIPAPEAVSASLAALKALREVGVKRFFFKYCSTFDSTVDGNIGPVAEALMDALEVDQTIVCPAFPRAGRSVYQGHLFVKGRLLNDSGMENHPLNPMTDADLVRFLAKQARRRTGLLSYEAYAGGPEGVARRMADLAESGVGLVIADICDDSHLETLAAAVAGSPLVTGGSGIGKHLPEAYKRAGILRSQPSQPTMPEIAGRSVILSGSCSSMTNQQVAYLEQRCPSLKIDAAAALDNSEALVETVIAWASDAGNPVLVYSTAPPEEVTQLQRRFGAEALAGALESVQASIAKRMVDELGVRRLVLAGGETSGAIVDKLGVRALQIGPEICAGVPWTVSIGEPRLALALKSGNFGAPDFFEVALGMLESTPVRE